MKENITEEVDLFIEQNIDQIKYFKDDVQHIYLNNVRKIFSKNINFDNKNKIMKSDKYPNYRFHYFDFRNDFPEFLNIIDLINNLPPFYLTLKNIDYIINTFITIKKEINNFKLKINKNSQNKIIKKIYSKYQNNKIKNKIIFLLNKYFNDIFYNKLIDNIDDLLDYLYTNYDTFKNNYLSFDFKLEFMFEIEKKIKFIDYIFFDIFQLTDIYLIRRILDKKYTKKNIIYTGLAHFSLITYFLVKYFDFKITHIHYLSNEIININELEQYIINGNNYNYLINYFYNKNNFDVINQCVNLFDFPINMS